MSGGRKNSMETANDDRVLYFRCAETGKRFSVTFHRYSPAHKFQIVRVTSEEPAAAAPEKMPAETVTLQPMTVMQHVVDDIQERGLSAVGSLLKSAGQRLVKELNSQLQASSPLFGNEFAISDFDMAGWYCPHCNHGHYRAEEALFVQCGKCREYVCGARARTVGDKQIFSCHNGCGGGGEVSGTMTSYRGRGNAPDSKALHPTEQRKIKTPPRRSLPPK